MATAGFERGLMLRSPARFQETAQRLVHLYRENQSTADADPSVRDAVIRAYLDAESYCLATYQTACRLSQGGKIGDVELDLEWARSGAVAGRRGVERQLERAVAGELPT